LLLYFSSRQRRRKKKINYSENLWQNFWCFNKVSYIPTVCFNPNMYNL